MLLTLSGLLIATVVSLIGAITADLPKVWKVALGVLAVAGFSISALSAQSDDRERKAAVVRADDTQTRLKEAQSQLQELKSTLALVNGTVGDLGKLKELSADAKYFVRVAADTDPRRLQPFLDGIDKNFRGARDSGMVCIRKKAPDSKLYELVFGDGLDLAAAEVFHRLASSHRLPPAGEIATIEPETTTPCPRTRPVSSASSGT